MIKTVTFRRPPALCFTTAPVGVSLVSFAGHSAVTSSGWHFGLRRIGTATSLGMLMRLGLLLLMMVLLPILLVMIRLLKLVRLTGSANFLCSFIHSAPVIKMTLHEFEFLLKIVIWSTESNINKNKWSKISGGLSRVRMAFAT